MSPRERIERLAQAYRARRASAVVVAALAGGALAGTVALRGGADGAVAAAAALASAAVVAVLARRYLPRIDAIDVARHVDRSVPAAEESATLLLAGESASALERLQRRRAEAGLAGHELRLPRDGRATRMIGTAGALALAAVAVHLAPDPAPDAARSRPGSHVAPTAREPFRIVSARIAIRPPAYTGRPAREQDSLEVDADEGAVIRWRLRAAGDTRGAALVTSAGDTVALAPNGAGELEAALVARRSAVYSLQGAGDSLAGEVHRLIVRPDRPPEVTVLRPAPRSELPHGAALRVPVEVAVVDDHGAGAAELVATVTTGSGESVRFREQRIPLSPTSRSRYRAELDLAALGMAPGDELYFHALARDNRPPVPNEGRSATVFLALADTASGTQGLLAAVALPSAPEFFRSQRQIIIDTERLLAEAPRLPAEIFRERSNAIGMDQGLLRLRYGQFTGEEFEEGAEAGEVHDHDDPENATLLARSVKATLKAAIAEMWEAELRLRTYRPAEALPYEYRALELLKSVQQADRSYVQRVGFEPPPLDFARRLTGRVAGRWNPGAADSTVREDEWAAVRAALDLVRDLARGGRPALADHATLAAADDALAGRAGSGRPRDLEALRQLRLLRRALADPAACRDCAGRAAAALAAALPVPAPAGPARGPGRLGRRYAELVAQSR